MRNSEPNFKYYHRDRRLIYIIGPILLTLVAGFILILTLAGDGVGISAKAIISIVLLFGISSLIIELTRKDRVWKIENGTFYSPKTEIDLKNIKRVECAGGEFLEFKIGLANGESVKLDPPAYPFKAGSELFELLETIVKNNKRTFKKHN